MQGAHIFQSTLFRGVSKLIHYFDVKGAQIFQNTLFRGVQTFIVILMSGDFKATPLCAIVFFAFF